jgi:pimeloyl-ACP methyl ester carboxylesterase
MAKKAIQAIAATDKNQVALDDNMNQNTMQNGDGAHHGAFTGYLLDYLNNPNVLDQNGILTATQVGSYLQKAVPRGQISQNPVYGPLYGTEGAEFIFQIFAQSKTNSIDDQPVNQPLSDLLRAEDVEQFNLLRGEAPNLAKQSFRRRNLEHANFKNAILCDVNLSEADAKGADFSGADLSDACLDFADLRTAEFKGSVLEKASFQFALLSGAKNLERAGLDPQSFDGANFDSPEVDGDAQTHSGIASFFDLKSAPAKYVEVGSYKTRYLDYPRPICENKTAQEPIPTVLLHGLLGSADTWLLMTNSLSKYLRLIVPDIIGSGDSDKPNVKYDLEFFMKFLSDFFASLSIGKANIVAMSVGARQAIEFTLRFPSLVNKLVLCSPQILYPGFPIDGVINAVTSMDGPALMKALIQGTNVNDYYARDIDAGKAVRSSVDYFVQNIQQPELRHSYASTLCELQNYPALPGRLSKISVPTLLVWGEEDSMSPISYAAQFNEIPNLQYLKMEDCGHAIPLEKPLELSKAILKFLLNLG